MRIARRLGKLGLGFVDIGQDGDAALVIGHAVGRWRYLPRCPRQQAHAETAFELLDALRHRRPVQVQLFRRPAKAAQVNNAGEQHPGTDIRDITTDQLQRTFQTNIFAMFYLVQAARPHLGKGAAIINCTSATMYQGSGELLDYSAAKGAITAFTRSLSENLIGQGIRVNAVAPGPIRTPLNPMGGATPEKLEAFGKNTPMGRPGQPNEVAPAFLFLACEDSSYMSGQVLHPNGGTIVNG